MLQPYLIAWWAPADAALTLRNPWWRVGARLTPEGPEMGYIGAIEAADDEHAMQLIFEAYVDESLMIDFHHVEHQPYGWSPFTETRPRESWMIWRQKPH